MVLHILKKRLPRFGLIGGGNSSAPDPLLDNATCNGTNGREDEGEREWGGQWGKGVDRRER